MTSKEQRQADACHEHARRCQKAIDRCPTCQINIQWFAPLPLGVLSDVLSESGPSLRRRVEAA
jgi:hypothetical protein